MQGERLCVAFSCRRRLTSHVFSLRFWPPFRLNPALQAVPRRDTGHRSSLEISSQTQRVLSLDQEARQTCYFPTGATSLQNSLVTRNRHNVIFPLCSVPQLEVSCPSIVTPLACSPPPQRLILWTPNLPGFGVGVSVKLGLSTPSHIGM